MIFLIKTKLSKELKRQFAEKKQAPLLIRNLLVFFLFLYQKNYPGREHFSDAIHVDINLVNNDILDIEAFRKWQPHLANAKFILEDGKYICGWEVGKMIKIKI